jgi:hypothetical protein
VVHSKIKWSSRTLPRETDPTRLDLAKIARRLEQLIRQSNDPEREKAVAEAILSRNNLWNGSLDADLNPYQFAQALIMDNDLLYGAFQNLRRVWGPANLSETVDELIEEIIPGEADVLT